jgi:hypothetical protein
MIYFLSFVESRFKKKQLKSRRENICEEEGAQVQGGRGRRKSDGANKIEVQSMPI